MINEPLKKDYIYTQPESEFFIKMLADHLAGRSTQPQDNLDWDILSRLAYMHQVSAIAYMQCKNFIPVSQKKSYEAAYSTALFYYANRVTDMNDISNALVNAGIPFFPVKGLDVAKYYPTPELRTMGDCDIVIRRIDTKGAVNILKGLGFKDGEHADVHAWTCGRNGRTFELHNILVEDDNYANTSQRDFFNNFMPYVYHNQLDFSFHFLFLLMHLRKHFFNNGVGIRQFMDLAVVIERCSELKWEWIEEKLEELDLRKYAHACYSLAERWFGVSAPVDYEKLDEKSVQAVTEKILSNGIFGFADIDNRGNGIQNSMMMVRGPILIKRISTLLKRVFAGYEGMKEYPGCTYLNGRPYLLPIAWIHRIGIVLRKKDEPLTAAKIRSILISKKELEKRQDLFEIMGL